MIPLDQLSAIRFVHPKNKDTIIVLFAREDLLKANKAKHIEWIKRDLKVTPELRRVTNLESFIDKLKHELGDKKALWERSQIMSGLQAQDWDDLFKWISPRYSGR